MKVSVLVGGRAICRLVNTNLFEALLLQVDRRHALKLKIVKTFGGEESLVAEYSLPESTKIEIALAGAAAGMNPPGNKHPFSKIVNLDSKHGSKISLIQHDIVSNPALPRTSYLKVPQAKPYTNKMSQHPYEIWKHSKANGRKDRPLPADYVGDEIGIDYDVPAGAGNSLTVKINTFDGAPETQQVFRHEVGVSYEIKLDNMCISNCYVEDFWLYYKIVDGRQVEIEETVPDNKFKNLDAACNPVQGDPNCDWGCYVMTGQCSCS